MMNTYLDAPVFDRESVLELVDGEVEFVQELAEMFAEDLPSQLDEIRSGLANGNAEVVQQIGHRLKSSIGNLGGRRAEFKMRDLEQQARTGNLHGLDELFEQCQSELSSFQDELDAFLATAE